MATIQKLPSGTYRFLAYGVDRANPSKRNASIMIANGVD